MHKTNENRTEQATAKAHRRFRTKRLLAYALKSKWSLLTGFLLTACAVGSELGGVYLIGTLLDDHIKVGNTNMNFLLAMVALFFLATTAAAAFRYFAAIVFQKGANRITADMQTDVFRHVQTLPISYFDQLPAGKVVSRITNDAKAVRTLFVVVLVQLTTALAYMLGIYIILLALDINLFWLALLPLPVIVLVVHDFRKKSAIYNKDYRQALSDLNGNLNENIQGMEVIHATQKEDEIYHEFAEINQRVYDNGYKMTKLYAYSVYNATNTLQYILLALVMLYFGYGHVAGLWLVPIGNLYVFVDYMNRFFGQVSNGMTRLGELERALGAADHMFQLLQQSSVVERPNTGIHLDGSLRFEHVTFAYASEPVLQDVSFQIEPGETVAFVGHTGSGKSTIMNLLFDFYEPQSGDIWFNGVKLRDLGQDEVRRDMAIVLQDPFLFEGTIYSNLTLGDDDFTRADAIQALIDVGGAPFLSRLAAGIDTPVKEKGNEFSQGERQLISFARAMLRNPKVLVLDEATANIDSATEVAIAEGIKRLEVGRTTLIIAHRLSTIKHADQIHVLDKGRIVESGRHDALIAQNGIYYRMYEAQSREAS